MEILKIVLFFIGLFSGMTYWNVIMAAMVDKKSVTHYGGLLSIICFTVLYALHIL